MSETAENFWFCLKSKPRQEAVAVRNLKAVGEIEIFFPRIRRTRRGHEKNKEVIEPFSLDIFLLNLIPKTHKVPSKVLVACFI
ncbi:MAG: hypothetical protein EBQ49_05305 [Verrucomicrobia bacterium]|nr:hypothetical protein [Verrucomicrobiota bacterium]